MELLKDVAFHFEQILEAAPPENSYSATYHLTNHPR